MRLRQWLPHLSRRACAGSYWMSWSLPRFCRCLPLGPWNRVDFRKYPIATLGERECFGETAILDDEPRSASVRALESTQVLKIDRESFRELVTERPQISFAIFKILTSRLRYADLAIQHVASFDSARHAA